MKIGKQEFRVNETDLNELKAIQKSGTHTTREVKRAEILLHVSEGKSPQEISEWVKRSEGTVYEVCRRYREGGLARALYDGARPGQPPKLDFRQESEITMLACSDAPEGHARWSVRLLRDAVIERQITDSISREKDSIISKKNALKPWLKEEWCISKPDGDYIAAMEAVLDVYEQAEQEDVARICFDEMPYQMVDDVLTPLPMRSGATAKQDYEYERKGCSCVLLAYDLDRGVRYTEVREHRRKADYAEFMDHLIKTHYSDKRKVLWVQDNLNTHTYGALYENLPIAQAQALRKQVTFHFTPKHGSWLNIAECEFSVLVRQCLDRRLPSIDRVRQEVNAWQNERNAHATKVRWTFTTSQAQSKMARHYAALNQSPVTSDAYFLRK